MLRCRAPLHIRRSENAKASRLDVIGQLDIKTNQRGGEGPFRVPDRAFGWKRNLCESASE